MSEDKEGDVVQEEQVPEAAMPEPSKKKKGRKPVVIGIVVLVVVVLGVGFKVWHDQPSFCNAICHNAMDGYIDTYDSTPGQATTDIWGNEVEDASGMLAAVHRVKGNATCLTCHVPTISEQVGEAVKWASGNYLVPLDERNLTQLTEASGKQPAMFCTNDTCHTEVTLSSDGSFQYDEGFIALAADYEFNPHAWTRNHKDFGSLECSSCHKSHRASVLYCTQCHSEAVVPDGWISYEDQSKLDKLYADI